MSDGAPSDATTHHVVVSCTVNGSVVSRGVVPRLLASDFLRHELGLTGTHVGCEHGVCGACTVLVNGRAIRSCLLFAWQLDGADVETVESLAPGDELAPVQAAFRDAHALQCGFCTPGVLMSLTQVAREHATEEQAYLRAVEGHLCRCTGYVGMRNAATRLAELASETAATAPHPREATEA